MVRGAGKSVPWIELPTVPSLPLLPEFSVISPVVTRLICNYGQSTCSCINFSVPSGYVLGLFIKGHEQRDRGEISDAQLVYLCGTQEETVTHSQGS